MFVSGNNVPSWWATRFSFKLTCSHGVTQRNNRHGRHISLTYIPNLSLYRTIEEVKFFSFPLSRDISSSREKKNDEREKRNYDISPFSSVGKHTIFVNRAPRWPIYRRIDRESSLTRVLNIFFVSSQWELESSHEISWKRFSVPCSADNNSLMSFACSRWYRSLWGLLSKNVHR